MLERLYYYNIIQTKIKIFDVIGRLTGHLVIRSIIELRAANIARCEEPLVQDFNGVIPIHWLVNHEDHAAVFCNLVPLLSCVSGTGNYIASQLDVFYIDVGSLPFHSEVLLEDQLVDFS